MRLWDAEPDDACLDFSGDDSMSMAESKAALDNDLKTPGSILTFFKALPAASWECVSAWQSRIDELLRLLRRMLWRSVADALLLGSDDGCTNVF